jgi:hypothetical protein
MAEHCELTTYSRCRREHTTAQFALLELRDLKLFSTCAFADETTAAAMRAARRLLDGVRNAMSVCE